MALDIQQTTLAALMEQTNIAEQLDEKVLTDIGLEVVRQVEYDRTSRSEWETCYADWIKLASQIFEEKNYPWPKAANIKYPLLTTASMQFHARAQQALIGGSDLVNVKVLGEDPDGKKEDRATRVGGYMSWQLLVKQAEWLDDTDRLLLLIPIVGNAYKKVYWSAAKRRAVSELVLPIDLFINYHARNFEVARKTHRIWLEQNTMVSRMRSGEYLSVELGSPQPDNIPEPYDATTRTVPSNLDSDQPFEVYEMHGWYDLDGDGYKEPWILTVEKQSKKVLRITPRFEGRDVTFNENGEVASITPTEYFVQYGFIPNPESSVYWQGLGSMVGPINHGVNTIINQLIDAGTLAVLQSGFLARGVRLQRGGKMRFKPGEWKILNTKAGDLRNGVYPLPVKEPSSVLFSLLSLLIDSGEKVSSVADLMQGESPGQNQPYSTTAAMLEQGMQVFVGIYKRLYRSLTREYRMLYRLNAMYLDEQEYFNYNDGTTGEVGIQDFENKELDISPAADPDIVSDAQRLIKAEALGGLLESGMVNPGEATRRMLEAQRQPNPKALLELPPPQPSPDAQLEAQRFAETQRLEWAKLRVESQRAQYEPMKDMAQAMVNMSKADAIKDQKVFQTLQLQMQALLARMEQSGKEMQAVTDLAGTAMKLSANHEGEKLKREDTNGAGGEPGREG